MDSGLRLRQHPQKVGVMGLGLSMLMITVGAIMRFAVSAQGSGFNVHTTGVVLMAVGGLGVVLSIAFWASWGGFGRIGGRQATVVSGQTTTTVRERDVV